MTLGRRDEFYEREDFDESDYDYEYDDLDVRPVGRGGDLDRYRPESHNPRRFWARLLAGVLAIVVTVWALALTAQQVTSPEVALPAHERAIESLVGLEEVLAIHEDEIRTLAASLPSNAPVSVPGFPITGVLVTPAEIQGATVEEWHELILSRAAEMTYEEGAAAFSEAGFEPEGGFLSATNALVRLMGSMSESRHEQLGGLVNLLALVALALAAAMLVVGEGIRRLVPAGGALVAAGVLVAMASVVAMGIVMAAGNDNSVVARELTSMAGTFARAPLSNAIWLAVAGLLIAVPAHIGARIFDPRADDDLDPAVREAW